MANPTSNFGWQMPTNTDLVKDLPADFEVFGQAVDTSLMDLKGGTTGQVLSKASNTDMDFTWVTSDDANAIQNTIVDAKGDLISASAADVPARLAVGNNGETLVADSSATTGLRWQGNFAAGKNKIINGDFRIWQRGTSFTPSATTTYTADRWASNFDGSGACTVSQQTFTAGTAPVAGYEGQFFLRQAVTTTGTSTYFQMQNAIEDVRTLAGQTATVSFWAKAETSRNGTLFLQQNFGSGGSGTVTVINQSFALTTSWQRFTFTAAIPSISGKTIGTNNLLHVIIRAGATSVGTQLDLWGVQVEAGDTATAFQTATGTLAGELAACQRYYQKSYNTDVAVPTNATLVGIVQAVSPNALNGWTYANVVLKTEMRVAPTVTPYSYTTSQTNRASDMSGTDLAASSAIITGAGTRSFGVYNNSGGTITAAFGGFLFHYQASAEL